MTESDGVSTRFPEGGRRVIFYLFYDHDGIVDDYIPYKLERLRPFAEHIFVIVNGEVTPEGRAKLEAVADTVWQRENKGFDVWGYKEGLEEFGQERLAEYDEAILMNYTWFGPVNPLEPIFARMDASEVDFWGMTAHARQVPNPFTRTGVLPEHYQSHWIAVRPRMFQSETWRRYWAEMPEIVSYTDSILSHESRFTEHFRSAGFVADVAFPLSAYSTWHPAFYDAEKLLDDGCPVLKRRPFFHDPLLLDRHAVIASRFVTRAAELGYPEELIWQNVSRTSAPRSVNTNAALLEIMPSTSIGYDEDKPLRIAVIMHIFYLDLARELLDAASHLPPGYDLIITTSDEQRASVIGHILDERADDRIGSIDLRVLPSNSGRDLGAFFVGAVDVIRDESYDVIFKIHSKKTVQESLNAGTLFRRQQLDNLLDSDGYARNLLGLFQREPGLGIVYAPTLHIGYPTLGRGWFENRPQAERLAAELGISVPFDDPSPLAPYGCMFAFRPSALRILSSVDWRYEDYPAANKHWDGSLAHVQERLFSYAAGQLGYHTKTVATTSYAAISHTSLEYKLDRISKNIPGYAIDQVGLLDGNGEFLGGGGLGFLKAFLRVRHPRIARLLRVPYLGARWVYRSASGRPRRDTDRGAQDML